MDSPQPNQGEYGSLPAVRTETPDISSQQQTCSRPPRVRKRAAKPSVNPLHRGIREYLTQHLSQQFYNRHDLNRESLVSSLPKRFTLYPPLLLLNVNAFSATPQWQAFFSALHDDQCQQLYACIADAFSEQRITHIAINAPIVRVASDGSENRMRSPSGLVPLYGDFGPIPTWTEGSADDEQTRLQNSPTDADFGTALWVRTVQNSGIIQTWAPLYTMFSRGNISEKARILGLRNSEFRGLDEGELGQPVEDIAVADMYAGIGYFVFSYLKRGVGRVWAWEMNPWSIEGLRRGCGENGWGIKVVQVDDEGSVEGGIGELVESLTEEDRVVAFLGDNCFAADVMHRLKAELQKRKAWKAIRHVNLGLLPSSRQSWKGSVEVMDPNREGWIHVHENVEIEGIDAMTGVILEEFGNLLASSRNISQPESARDAVTCVHVEEVKTYAPGVMHCVFDLRIAPMPKESEEVLE